jgi:hypothetical protein
VRLPVWVTIVAILLIIGGVFGVLWGFAQIATGSASLVAGVFTFSEGIRAWGGSTLLSGFVDALLGVVQLVTAFGLFARQHWAWVLALALAVVWILSALVGLFSGHYFAIFSLIVPVFILVAMLQTSVREFFASSTASTH